MNSRFLRSNLCFVHGTMTASEGLLQAAIRKGDVDNLGLYFTRHLAEETGHLQMLEADLKSLGVSPILKFPQAAQLAGAQYYYIEHEHPALLLGYMAALESSPMPISQVNALEADFGPLTCLRHHALHDPEHAQELRQQIERLDPALRQRALENEALTLHEIRTRVLPAIEAASNYFLRH